MSDLPPAPVSLSALTGYFLRLGTFGFGGPIALTAAMQRGPAAALDEMPLEEVERILIQKALDRCGGNVSQAAKALGLSRSALYRRLRQHGF